MHDEKLSIKKQDKSELLLRLLKQKARSANSGITKSKNKYDRIPLSWGQQQLWMLSKLSDSSNEYNMPLLFKLNGELDKEALIRVFDVLISRHEILRTRILVDGLGNPYQQSTHADEISIEWSDIPEFDDILEREQLYDRLLNHYISKPFDLSRDQPIRVAVFGLSDSCHAVLIVIHHIACDAWSTQVLASEISILYENFSKARPSPLKELELQYSDYAIWQREHISEYITRADLEYWRGSLEGAPLLELPIDRPRPPIQSHKGDNLFFSVEPEAAQQLKQFGQGCGCTLFMTVLAVFNIFLHKYSQQNDICVGTPVANRVHSEFHPVIGYFVNTIVLRNFIDPLISFSQLLNSIKISSMNAYEHQQVPFEKVVEIANPKRSRAYTPCFQVMLVLQNTTRHAVNSDEALINYEKVHTKGSKFDLTLTLEEMRDGSLQGSFEYSTDLFNESTIQKMALHFVELIKALVKTPHETIGQIEFLPRQERQQQLGWNNTSVSYPNERCIHELFESEVVKNPHAVAVSFENEKLSYFELNAKANQLAHYLVDRRAVKPDSLVGICVERSLHMIIGIVAILKAGGAYVPLDPDYPESRLRYMRENASLDTIILQRSLKDKINFRQSSTICIDDLNFQAELSALPTKNIEPASIGLASSHLAYVIYTSGSTGQPKGVMIEHKALVNRILWMDRQYGCSSLDKILQKTPFSFDVSVWEILWPIVSGASMVLARPGGHRDPLYLSELISNEGVTKLHFVPSMLSSMLSYGDLNVSSSLKQVFCSGEALSLSHVSEFRSRYPHIELHNLYGPTEASIDVSYWSAAHFHNSMNTIPIGKPIQNIQLYVLDRQLNLVPTGVAGELFIGGAGLARGYVGRPDLTSERFVNNPFFTKENSSSREVLYKTGDLCRYLPDGNIEYLGRLDHQIKIKGFRIELGEIENALASHDLVKEAVVIAKANLEGEKQLIAYVVPNGIGNLEGLKSYVEEKLPKYMVPSAFVALDVLPLTLNGKVDRKTLEALDITFDRKTSYVAPRTTLEHEIVKIWSRILELDSEKIGINDNFFELGGQSLSVIRASALIKTELGLEVGVLELFDSPTITALAERLKAFSVAPGSNNLKSNEVLGCGFYDFSKICNDHHILGANIAIFENQNLTLLSHGYKCASKSFPMIGNVKFRIYCINKVLLTIVALILKDKKLVEIDVPLSEQFQSLMNFKGYYKDITLTHLLNHTSGIDDSALFHIQRESHSLDDFIHRITDIDFLFKPGENFAYSSAGLSIVAYVIEHVTGMSWKKAIDEFLFIPLDISFEEDCRDHISAGYSYSSEGSQFVQQERKGKVINYLEPAESALMLSVIDLIKIANVSLNGTSFDGRRILDKETSTLMHEPSVEVDSHYVIKSWALGWWGFNKSVFGFMSGDQGHHTLVAINASVSRAFVAQTNTDMNLGFFDTMVQKVMGMSILNTEETTCDFEPEWISGDYEAQGLKINITSSEGTIYAHASFITTDGNWSEPVSEKLIPFHKNGFVTKNKKYPFDGAIGVLNPDLNNIPQMIRIKQKLCVRKQIQS